MVFPTFQSKINRQMNRESRNSSIEHKLSKRKKQTKILEKKDQQQEVNIIFVNILVQLCDNSHLM